MDMLTGIIMVAISAVVGTWAHVMFAPWVNQKRKERALGRLMQNPLCRVGAELLEVREPGCDRELMGPAVIIKLALGELWIRSRVNPAHRMVFTGLEWETLHPVYIVEET